MLIKLLLILFEIGFGLKFNIVGTISASELFLLGASVFFIKKRLFHKYPELKTITWLYLGLFASQVLSEVMVGNEIANALKGFAVTIISYLHFIFLFRYLIKDRKHILYIFIGIIACLIIFGTDIGSDTSMEEVLAGEGASFLKFYVVGFVTNGLLILSVMFRQRTVAIVSMLSGAIVLILGARSSGGIIFIMGLIPFLVLGAKRAFTRRQVMRVAVIALVAGYGVYCVYVSKVLAGNITSGNSWQLVETKNPYNPINVLRMGRGETFIGAQAFIDAPLTGHGAWTPDLGWKYHSMQAAMNDSDGDDGATDIIPAHSVLIGAGTNNGILAFLFMGAILWFFIKRGFKLVKNDETYLIIIVFCIFSLIWNGLFSATSIFRNNFPIYFAMILVSYLINNKKNDSRHTDNYSHAGITR
jgi:hypothetical protein